MQGLDDLAEGQHADQVAIFHHDERTDVALGHRGGGVGQVGVRRHGVQNVALDLQDFRYLHLDPLDWRCVLRCVFHKSTLA
jgi:hypothetical protein